MIFPVIPGLRLTGYSGHNTDIAKGRFMYVAGVFNSGTHKPLGTPGYSSAGDKRMLLATSTTSGYGVFPVNKLILKLEGADQDNDVIASGQSLIYYVGGQYMTDEYDKTVSGTGTTIGTKLWLNASGQITTAASANTKIGPIGEVVEKGSLPNTSYWYTGGTAGAKKIMVTYQLYPTHMNPQGIYNN